MRESPVTVMARAVLEHAFPDEALDRMFRRMSQQQYEDKLLFSTVVKVLAAVVTRGRKSVRNSYLADTQAQAQASLAALYVKLQNTETAVVSGLVRESFVRLLPVIQGLKAVRPALFPGYCTKVLDGAHLTGTQHRPKETRTFHSSPLPGQALVVLQPDQRLIGAVFPCEDAHAQERSLLDGVLATIESRDLLLGDRNFCTTEFLFEPTPDIVLGEMLPHYLNFQMYQILLEAKASEHSARMVAMKNATDNAQQLIKDLTLEYNKLRQANITKELLEITTAQMAMG